MGFMSLLFSEQELESLDESQRQILKAAILQQMQTSPEINDLLKKMLGKDPASGASAQS
jgi:hypothetical protein